MTKKLDIFILLSIVFFILLLTAGSYGVIESSDARYAEIAREMFHSNDYLHPSLLDIHHYHKPPITYQITSIGYHLFGVNPFGARFFLEISVVLQIFLVYILSFELYKNRQISILASIIYISFPMVLASSRNLTTDSFLTTAVLLSIYLWVRYKNSGLIYFLYGFSVAMAIGFLIKGPVVFLLPIPFMLLYRSEIIVNTKRVEKILAFGIFLFIASSWFIYLAYDNPAFMDYFIGHQTVDRFSVNSFNRSEPFWYFIVLAPLLGIPFLPFLGWLIWKNRDDLSMKRVDRVMILSVLIPLIILSISVSKRIFYILPLYPIFAILISYYINKLNEKSIVYKIITIYSIIIIFLSLVFGYIPFIVSIIILSILFFIYKLEISIFYKFISISLISSLLMVSSLSLIIKENPLKLKIATPVVEFLRDNNLENRTIFVYNKRLSSLAFELDSSTVSLYDGDSSLNREVQFEKNNRWRDYLYNLQDIKDVEVVKNRLNLEKSILVLYKREIPQNRDWLKRYYNNIKVLGKWRIYY